MPMKNVYETPEVELIRLRTACNLLQGSIDTNDIPDVEVVDFNWETV